MRALYCLFLVACSPSFGDVECAAALAPGDLVITEVFADYQATASTDGDDAGREWFEIYNATSRPVALDGVVITHSRLDGSRDRSHAIAGAPMLAPGAYLALGNAATIDAPYLGYGYGDALGELYNTGGGALRLACGTQEIDRASYDDVVAGHARALSNAAPPDFVRNDDLAQWCEANAAEHADGNFGTPGAANDCAAILVDECEDDGGARRVVVPAPGELVITEVMASPAAAPDATAEWLEVRATRDVDLNGVAIDRLHDTAAAETIANRRCLRVRAGAYAVIARSDDPARNGGLPPVAATFGLALVAGTSTTPGDLALSVGGAVIDAVQWTAAPTGAALQLDPRRSDATANDTDSNFCAATTPYGSGDRGTPGADNALCPLLPPAGTCDDHGALRAIVAPVYGQLAISEVLANPGNVAGATDATREWFEVANVGDTAFDLNELVVGRIDAPGTAIAVARCLSVAPRAAAVLARSADAALNGMLPEVAATFRFGLVDTNGDIQIASAAGVLDQLRWARATSGASLQVDPAHLAPDANDVEANRCLASASYGDGSNLATPGAGNRSCP